MTDEQASALNGITYTHGVGEAAVGGLSMCSWDNATARASVEVGFAFWPSPTAAQAAYDAVLGAAHEAGSDVTPVADLADAAAIAQQPGTQELPGVGFMYLRRGALVVTLGYYSGTAPTDAALKTAAAVVLGELPAFAK